MHWQGKFRGPDFAPMTFQLRTVTHERLKDRKGRLLPTVVASHLSDIGQQEIAKANRAREDDLLKAIAEDPSASLTELAIRLGWKMRDGKPYKVLVSRTLTALKNAKLVAKDRDEYTITPKGKKAAGKDAGKEVGPTT
jgi:hypothetical protein